VNRLQLLFTLYRANNGGSALRNQLVLSLRFVLLSMLPCYLPAFAVFARPVSAVISSSIGPKSSPPKL
jgi:hypothetical protein